MAYVAFGLKTFDTKHSIIMYGMQCYDTLDDDDFEWDRDHLLHRRSALEFIRDRLSDAQRAELDQIDAHWRAHAKAFNRAFANEHFRHKPKTVLTGFVTDEAGRVPPVPADHWWWHPIED